jgi:hemerythrin-like metal-binding protein
MSTLEWSDALSVGVAEIDDDHKKLVAMVNDLQSASEAGQATEVVGDILEGLLDYTAWHFRHEERLMQTYGDPTYIDHKALHEKLLQSTEGLHEKFMSGDLDVSKDLLPFLKDWLFNHIQGTDKTTGTYLASEMG